MSGNTELLCDRISRIAEQLENAASDLRGMPGVSRLRAALPDAVADLRNIAEQVLEQSAELGDLRAEREQLRDEYGIRVVHTSTEIFEGTVAETEAGARAIIANLDDEDRRDVVSRTLIHRRVTDWQELGGGDRG